MRRPHDDGWGSGGASPPGLHRLSRTAATPSRHDHYPRADPVRGEDLRQMATALETAWRDEDRRADGPCAAMAGLSPAASAADAAAVLSRFATSPWLPARIDAALTLLSTDPFALPPMEQAGEGVWALLLAAVGPWRLSLQLHRFEMGRAPPATTIFIPGTAAIHVLADGGALLHRHRIEVSADEEAGAFTAAAAARCESQSPRLLQRGEVLRLDRARESITLARGTDDVLLLELAAQPPSALPARTYDLASGGLVHVAASRRDSSFRMMAMTLLRTLGRIDAAPLFIAAADDRDFNMRWTAPRELVALDPAAARPHLAHLAAADPHPEVRRAAAATLMLYPTGTDPRCPA